MSAPVKTEAIVLKSMKYLETSMIVTFYTKQFGKLSGIVKGARQPKSKYRTALLPMSYVLLVVYKKEGRELQTVAQCDLLRSFRGLAEDIEKMAVGMSMIELVANIAHEEEENAPLFALIVDSLSAVNDATKYPANVFYYFELKLAALSGFQPKFDECISCRAQALGQNASGNSIIVYHLGRGGPLCSSCASAPGPLKKLSARNLRLIKQIAECDKLEQVLEIDIDYRAKEEINGFLWEYLKHHISGMRALKSTGVFSQIFDAS